MQQVKHADFDWSAIVIDPLDKAGIVKFNEQSKWQEGQQTTTDTKQVNPFDEIDAHPAHPWQRLLYYINMNKCNLILVISSSQPVTHACKQITSQVMWLQSKIRTRLPINLRGTQGALLLVKDTG